MQVVDIPAMYVNTNKRIAEQEKEIERMEVALPKIEDVNLQKQAKATIEGRKQALEVTKSFAQGIEPTADEISNPSPEQRQMAANAQQAEAMLREAATIRANIIAVTAQVSVTGDTEIIIERPDKSSEKVSIDVFAEDQELQAKAREAAAEALVSTELKAEARANK